MFKFWVILGLLLSKFVFAEGPRESFIKDIQNQCIAKVCNIQLDGKAFADLATFYLASQKNLDININKKKYSSLLWSLGGSCPHWEILSQSGLSSSLWRRFYNHCTYAVATVSQSPKTYVPIFSWVDNSAPPAKLWSWLISQQENSVTPLALFLAAVHSANGNVMDALMAASDVLGIGSVNLAQRNHYVQTLKLIDIRGDYGDNFLAWHNYFAAMAYAYFSGLTTAGFVVEIHDESCTDIPIRCNKRAEIDHQGVYAGAKLFTNLEALQNGVLHRSNLTQTPYLNIDPNPESEPRLPLQPRSRF